MNDNGMSPADVAAVVGNTDRNNFGYAYPYPVFPYGNMGGNNSGFGDSGSWVWLILILALLGGFGNNGSNGAFGGGFNNDYAWLSNGQKEIMQNTNDGFNTLQLANHLNGIDNSINSLSTQLCNCCADINATTNAGFANAETAANARQMANMQQAFNSQLSVLQGFNQISSDLASCCCENKLATQDLKATVISENCADREVLREIGQSILVNQTENTNRIISELFKDRLDEKDDKIAELNRQLQTAELRASQIAQTANIVDSTYARLRDCPIESTPIFRKNSDIYLPKQQWRLRLRKLIWEHNSLKAKSL